MSHQLNKPLQLTRQSDTPFCIYGICKNRATLARS